MSSNLIYALAEALTALDSGERFVQIEELSGWARAKIIEMGLDLVAKEDSAMPGLITISLPAGLIPRILDGNCKIKVSWFTGEVSI